MLKNIKQIKYNNDYWGFISSMQLYINLGTTSVNDFLFIYNNFKQ